MTNVSKWVFICPKCSHNTVRLKKLVTWGYQNVCESCGWKGIVAKETYLTEELREAHSKIFVKPVD